MKKLLLLLFLPLLFFASADAQVKVTDMPTFLGNADSAWVPIVINGVNRKTYGHKLGRLDTSLLRYIDSAYQVDDSLYLHRNDTTYAFQLGKSYTPDWGLLLNGTQFRADTTNGKLATQYDVNAAIAANTLTFENGLTKTGSVVKWGGAMTQNTTINGSNTYGLTLLDLNNIYATSDVGDGDFAEFVFDRRGGSWLMKDGVTRSDFNIFKDVITLSVGDNLGVSGSIVSVYKDSIIFSKSDNSTLVAIMHGLPTATQTKVLGINESTGQVTIMDAGSGGGGSGTVTSFAFTNGGGFTGSVTNATTTPTLSLTLDNDAITTAKIANAAVTMAKLSTTGTPDGTKFLRDDGQWTTVSGGTGEPSNGDKGDITVTNSGLTWAIDNDAITTAKINDAAVTAAKLANTTVTAGSYTSANITVDAQGRITAASNGSGGGGGIGGSIAANQVAVGSGSNTIAGSNNFIYSSDFVEVAANGAVVGFRTTNSSSNSGIARFSAINDQSKAVHFNMYPSNFAVASLAGKGGFGSDNGIIVFANAGVQNGGADDIIISAGGYDNEGLRVSASKEVRINGIADVGNFALQVGGNILTSGSITTGYTGSGNRLIIVDANGLMDDVVIGSGLTLSGGTLSASGGGGGSSAWGGITGTLSDQTDLQSALDGKVDENAAITGATKTKITYDAKGLVVSGADATTSDISEGSNLYYTDNRARNAISVAANNNLSYSSGVIGWDGLTARKNTGSNTGTRRRINFIEGNNVTLTVSDDNTDGEIDVTIAAAGGSGGDGNNYPSSVSAVDGVIEIARNESTAINTTASGNWNINAATVTNGVYTTGSYANPAWITSLAAAKITGLGAVATTNSYNDLSNLPTLFTVSGTASEGKVVKYISGAATWGDDNTGSGGEANTASNVGSGTGFYKEKNGVDLRFKSLIVPSEGGITVTSLTNEVQVKNSGYEQYGKTDYVTSNTTQTQIKEFTLPENCVGELIVEMLQSTDNFSSTGNFAEVLTFHKVSNTVTLSSPTSLFDNSIASTSWAYTTTGGHIQLKVTGLSATNIIWRPTYKIKIYEVAQ